MLAKLRFTLFFVLFLILLIVAVGSLGYFLRKLTEEYAKSSDSDKKHWWRYVVPVILAILLASWQHFKNGLVWNYLYLFFLAIGIPMALAFFFLRSTLEGKKERLFMLFALLLFLNAAFFSTEWYWHYRYAHSDDYDAGNYENPHLTVRNGFKIPIWILTVLVGAGAGWYWKKEGRKENEELLPYTAA